MTFTKMEVLTPLVQLGFNWTLGECPLWDIRNAVDHAMGTLSWETPDVYMGKTSSTVFELLIREERSEDDLALWYEIMRTMDPFRTQDDYGREHFYYYNCLLTRGVPECFDTWDMVLVGRAR